MRMYEQTICWQKGRRSYMQQTGDCRGGGVNWASFSAINLVALAVPDYLCQMDSQRQRSPGTVLLNLF